MTMLAKFKIHSIHENVHNGEKVWAINIVAADPLNEDAVPSKTTMELSIGGGFELQLITANPEIGAALQEGQQLSADFAVSPEK